MQRFYFNEKKRLAEMLIQLNSTMELFNTRNYDVQNSVTNLLKDSIKTYKDLGHSNKESTVQSLLAELVTALQGVNPYTLAKQPIRRSEMVTTVIFKVLQSLETQLRTDYNDTDEKLQQASALISQIIVAAIQGNLLSISDIENINTQTQIETAWKNIGADSNIALGQKRVLLQVSKTDSLILFADLISQLKS